MSLKKSVIKPALILVAGLLMLVVRSVFAQDTAAPAADDVAKTLAEHKMLLDTIWVMVAAFLVFFMQAGFAYVEGGLTRAKNTNNIMMKNLMDFCFGTLAFWAVGFAFMFGDGNPFVGTSGFFLGWGRQLPGNGRCLYRCL